MKLTGKIIISVFIFYLITLFMIQSAEGAEPTLNTAVEPDPPQTHFVSEPVTPGLSTAVRDLPATDSGPTLDREINPRHNPHQFEADMGQRGTWNRVNVPTDPLIQPSGTNTLLTPGLDLSFDATGNPAGCGSCSPPDINGDVGPNHYVHAVNATKIAIYNKSGVLLSGPFNLGTLWSSGNCTANAGDPIVLYDPLANRWLLSQFAQSSHMCIAISQTADPTGAYYTYTFNVGAFPDYFKFGVWPDGYYMSANESTYTAYAFDRARMLTGASATFQKYTGGTNLYLPSDVDGSAPPPTGAPNIFYTFKDNSYHGGGSDRIELREFHVDWTTPANSTFNLVTTLPIASFTYTPCGFFNFNCVRQLGTTQRFDALGEWPMFRFPYRNFGTHQSLVGTFVVGGGLGNVGAAVRWFELRKTGASWTLYQQGTHDPGDGHDRTNPSIAMDKNGNIAIGYTVSSNTINPGIRYATRLSTDPLGTLQTEAVLINGSGSQTGSNRWGDYAAMAVDPANDCSFWYTNEYYAANSANQWRTRVGVFTIPGCVGGPTPTPTNTTVPPTPTNTTIPPTASNTPLPPTPTNTPPPSGDVFFDNFETNLGWTVNPNGSDNATTGQWERGNPEDTNSSGPKQLGTTVSGSNDLVTGRLAGSSAGSYDIDGGTTSIRSPNITLPSSGNITLSFSYYLAHGTNSSSADFLRVQVVGSSTQTVFEELGAANDDDAVWATFSGSLNSFAGQTVYLLISAADASTASLVEAAIDDVRITGSGPTPTPGPTNTPVPPTATPPPSSCTTYTSTNVPIPLPNGTSTISSNLTISGAGTIGDLDVSVTMAHVWVGDLRFVLRNQTTGTAVTFIDRPGVPASTYGCSGDNINATLSDEAASAVENQCASGTPTINGTFSPNNALSAFDGQSGNGTWVLEVTDFYTSADAGTLNAWSVRICTP